jgi:hypothetical protein
VTTQASHEKVMRVTPNGRIWNFKDLNKDCKMSNGNRSSIMSFSNVCNENFQFINILSITNIRKIHLKFII